MTRRMSCSMTTDAVRSRIKTQTRRRVDTWRTLAVGDHLTLVEKAMGLPRGATQVILAEVFITGVDIVPLRPIGWDDITAEGLWDRAAASMRDETPGAPLVSPGEWFAQFWLAGHGYPPDTIPEDTLVRKITWRYL